jgi:hypothetical protein
LAVATSYNHALDWDTVDCPPASFLTLGTGASFYYTGQDGSHRGESYTSIGGGTVTNPAFQVDTQTGMFQSGVSQGIGLTTAGVARLNISANGGVTYTGLQGTNVFQTIGSLGSGTPWWQDNHVAMSAGRAGTLIAHWAASQTLPPFLAFAKSDTQTGNVQAAVSAGSQLGRIRFDGSDGTAFQDSAQILDEVEGTVAAGVVPSHMIFATATAAGVVTEAMRMDSTQNVKFAKTMQFSQMYSAAGTPLPTCNAGFKGARAVVSDASAPTWNANYASGGAVTVPVFCDGANWKTS